MTSARLEFLYGRHAVYEALRAERRGVYRILTAEGASEKDILADIITLAEQNGIPVHRVPRQKLDAQSPHHHGVAASVSEYPYVTVDEVIDNSLNSTSEDNIPCEIYRQWEAGFALFYCYLT